MHGVNGRMFIHSAGGKTPDRFSHQRWISEQRPAPQYGPGCYIVAEVRFDDDCRNGHNSFAITATVRDPKIRGDRGFVAGGCLHDDVASAFPELAHLIPWHLASTDGPMHYLANTVYLAGDRDSSGLRAGESDPRSVETFYRFGSSPIRHKVSSKLHAWLRGRDVRDLGYVPIQHREHDKPGAYRFGPKYTLHDVRAAVTFPCTGDASDTAPAWHECLFDSERVAREWIDALATCHVHVDRITARFGEGKARELDEARRAAIWPDATDEQLSAAPEVLRAALEARLPALLARFRADIAAAGFAWSAERVAK
jgi:hypothetical protein